MKNLILFGFKSCGKTYFGKLLAKELNFSFLDTDDLIISLHEQQFHQRLTCREIALQHGERTFRSLEKVAIKSIQPKYNRIISIGGGAVIDNDNYLNLTKLGALVYLELDKKTLKQRILSDLPSYLDGSDDSFEKMYQERKVIYEKIKDFHIALYGKTDEEVLNELKQTKYCLELV